MSKQARPDTPPQPQRRRFLATTASSGLLAATTSFAMISADAAPATALLQDLVELEHGEAQILLALARTLFPHAFLDVTHYAAAVRQLDAIAAGNAVRASLLRNGLRRLPSNFSELEAPVREQLVSELTASAFFKLTRRTTVNALYRNPEVWTHFGYPGPSLPFGGWVNRELVDIDWLPTTKAGT